MRPASVRAPSILPFHQVRTAVQSANAQKYKRKKDVPTNNKKKKRTSFYVPDIKQVVQFSLVDAMRYLKAAEVGRDPKSAKYELHVRLRTPKNGAPVRNQLRLPHPVRSDIRICVICPPDSAHAKAAKEAGAYLVGEDEVFEQIKAGKIDFDRCICQTDSLSKLSKAGVARTLGPRGLMPSAKTGSVVKNVASAVRDMAGGSEYRERLGVVRMSIGQLAFTPEQMQTNIRAFIEGVNKDIAGLSDRISKAIHEVVLSSTHGPGMSLNGDFRGPDSLPTKDLSVQS
ncbi:related to ribosomal L1 [Lecanosticta acicola]|uniref:Related to ribosomal L1 n=1 Tax=Lecanosticta acicola TaxID=111012 RepID=A0AAI9EAY8_9PEZI|nr:related to ribosomal L1 [Lecanosticta acicola]